jgi:hypothetical protein
MNMDKKILCELYHFQNNDDTSILRIKVAWRHLSYLPSAEGFKSVFPAVSCLTLVYFTEMTALMMPITVTGPPKARNVFARLK